MTSILAAIKGIADLFGMVKDLLLLYKQAKKEKWIKDGRELTHIVKRAKTNAQRKELVKTLAKHTSRM